MFWWLYYAGEANKPLILWLQGGPGGSSTGFGNFMEIGPKDVNLQPRNTTWLKLANLLFIDNPVGTGFSYVTSQDAYSTSVEQIALDLVQVMKSFLKEVKEFKSIPFYIFSESYGGKMTAAFSKELYKAIKASEIECNFKGFAMGDSWISPLDSVLSWAPYLYSTSLVDILGYQKVNNKALDIKSLLSDGKFKEATNQWSELESIIESETAGVDFYNILRFDSQSNSLHNSKSEIDYLYKRHVGRLNNDLLSNLMNTKVRRMLRIIPENVTWGGQSGNVFKYQSEEFMKPVVSIVDDILKTTPLKVVVYSGQLDLICDTLGTEQWVGSLTWPHMKDYFMAERKAIRNKMGIPELFYKTYKQFQFYWILKAGHMVPSDAGDAALKMVANVLI
ncbi:DgyrCDS11993 [Dimorphilus gyrociliatus]|nr:DgyrCDS11993 [Dimorphilus gyrociliatus]